MADTTISIIFYVASYLSLFVSIFWITTFLSYRQREPKKTESYPSVSLIIPAYNEEKTIGKCIKSLIEQNYPKLKILVVDDGSTDKTGQIAKRFAKKYNRITYIRKKNGGKGSAINAGLKRVNTEVFGFIDADTHLSKNALKHIAPHIIDDVVSITTVIQPQKSKNLLERLQKVEYAISSFTRKLMSHLGSLYYTPGFSVYKTSVIKKLGGFDEDNMVEDLEIGFRLKDKGYNIETITEHYASTVVPETFRELFRQRMRWYRGFIYNSRKYSHIFFNRRFGELGILILPVQYIMLALMTPLLAYGIYKIGLKAYQLIIDFFVVGVDISYFLETSNFFIITAATFFILIVAAAFLVMLKLSQVKVNAQISKLEYIIYIIIYPFITWALYTAAFIYELTGAKRKW